MTVRAHLWRRLVGRRIVDILDELRAADTWSPARVREVQTARLRALLLHAYQHVPYYRPLLLEAGVIRDDATPEVDLDRFTSLPLLTRAMVVRERTALTDTRPAGAANPRFEVPSGGTSGTRLRVLWDRAMYHHCLAVSKRYDEWTGYEVGDPRVLLWGGPHTRPTPVAGFWLGSKVADRETGWKWLHQVVSRLSRSVKNETRLPIWILNDEVLDRYLEIIGRLRPVQIQAFARPAHALARRALAVGWQAHTPRAVLVSSEALDDDMRETIGRAFRAPVFNRYGCEEVGGISCDCERAEGQHVSSLTNYVEILREDASPAPPGESGEVVVTSLVNFTMPLIRYQVGDMARPLAHACSCGRPFPIIDVLGRSLDALVRPDGKVVHSRYVRRFSRDHAWIAQVQVIQRSFERIDVRLVDRERRPDPLTSRRFELEAIRRYLQEAVGIPCEVRFEFVADIPAASSAKFRAVISDIMTEPSTRPPE